MSINRTRTDWIIIHCSATKPSQSVGVDRIREWHMAKGWEDVGYHFVVRRDGSLELGRPINTVGAHVRGYNSTSVGVCLEGGLLEDGGPAEGLEAYTAAQVATLDLVIKFLKLAYPGATCRGHRDFSPDLDGDGKISQGEWMKNCPCFDVRSYWQ